MNWKFWEEARISPTVHPNGSMVMATCANDMDIVSVYRELGHTKVLMSHQESERKTAYIYAISIEQHESLVKQVHASISSILVTAF